MKPKYLALIFLCLILIGVIGLIHPLSMSDQAGTSPQPTPVPANPFPEKEYIPITNFTENLTELNAHLAWNYTGEEIHSAAAELRRIFFYAYDVGSDTYQIPGFAAYSSQIKYALNLSSEQEVAFLRYLQSEFYGEEQKPNSRHTSPVLIRTMGNQREDAESIAKWMENYYYHQETGPVRKLIFSEYPNGYITTWAYDDYGYVTVSCSSENPPSINEMNLLSETWNTAAKKAGLSEIPLRFRDAGSGEIQRVYAFVPDAARINEWIRTVHENPDTASIRELLRQISGEEGYLCGWQYHPDGYLYVFSSHERLPTEDEMQKFVQVWNTAAAAANLPDIPVKFMKVYVPREMIAYDQPITLDVVFPAEGEVVYGDVVPLATSVYVNVLSPNGIQCAWIESDVHQRESEDLPVRDSRREIVTMSGSTGPIQIQQGMHAYTVTATDLKGNSVTKVINITVVLGLPSPSKFR